MTQETFEYIKTLIQGANLDGLIETDPDEGDDHNYVEFPNVRDRLKDGANLIDLYVELGDYLNWQECYGVVRESTSTGSESEQEEHFWKAAEEVLVEPDEKAKDEEL